MRNTRYYYTESITEVKSFVVQAPGEYVFKLFSSSPTVGLNKLGRLSLASFKSFPIFVIKTSLPGHVVCPTRVGSSHTHKYLIRVKSARRKHSSLFCLAVSDEEKSL
jgi:hypothetical protein